MHQRSLIAARTLIISKWHCYQTGVSLCACLIFRNERDLGRVVWTLIFSPEEGANRFRSAAPPSGTITDLSPKLYNSPCTCLPLNPNGMCAGLYQMTISQFLFVWSHLPRGQWHVNGRVLLHWCSPTHWRGVSMLHLRLVALSVCLQNTEEIPQRLIGCTMD